MQPDSEDRGAPWPPGALTLADARVHDITDSLVLVVLPLETRPDWAALLTRTELAVATLAASGLSNRALAELRGSSQRTIANQLASVYRKLSISGRRELRAHIAGRTDARDR